MYNLHDCYGINEQGHLTLGGADTVELAKKYGTPLYLLDENKIRRQCRIYKEALEKHFPEGSMPLYASKALSFVDIYKIVKDERIGIDIVSPGELYTALSAGFDVSCACFHGNNKTDADIEYGISSNVGYIVVDSKEELEAVDKIAEKLGKTQNILLRITPGIDPHTLQAINTGKVDSKFGTPIIENKAEEITALALSKKNAKLCGFHCHIGSQIFEPTPFTDAAKVMISFISDIKDKYGFETDVLNIGGGFAVRYLPEHSEVNIAEYIADIAKSITSLCEKFSVKMPKIFMEPGRSIVAAAGVTLYTVGTRKEIPGFKNYISIDGGMPDNPRYALYQSPYSVLCADRANAPKDYKATICGRCCESGDLIAEDIAVAKMDRGDTLAVLVTGAYNYSMASNYNRIPRPPIVIVNDGKDRLSVRRESFEDLIKNEVL